MFGRPCDRGRLMRTRSLFALLAASRLALGCSQFEPPLVVQDAAPPSDTPDAGPVVSADTGVDTAVPKDTGVAARDAEIDATVAVEVDATSPDAGDDAGLATADAATPDAALPLPKRPVLPKCGFAAPITTGTITGAGLNEVSGIAVSRRNAQVIWLVEDSGNASQVHAVNEAGTLLATYNVSGAAIDIEDIATGPGPIVGQSYLYIADIGDNSGSRASITVYRAPEPEVTSNQSVVSGTLTMVENFPMKYPDGKYNAEALLVDPVTEDIYLVTKDGFARPNMLYRLAAPHKAATLRTLEDLGGLYGGNGNDLAISAGDISADGRHIVVRSLHSVSHWSRSPGVSIADTMLKSDPCDGELSTQETKGESISFSGNGYFTLSEGTLSPLHFVSYTPP